MRSNEGLECGCHSHGGFLTAKGLKEAAQRDLELSALDAMGIRPYLDKVGSVSGLRRDEDMYALVSDTFLDSQSERFHNGS